MKLKIKKEILLESLNNVSKAISTKNLIPILSGIKFDLKKDGLYLLCSDDDITIQAYINKKYIEELEEGIVIIPGRYILDIIRKIPSDIINIETDGLKIIISTPTSIYNLNGMDYLEYPNKALELSKKPIILNKKVFKNIINQTSFAISTQESRPILTGINLCIKSAKLEAVATDSYRLSKKIISINEKKDEEIDIVIPGRNMSELIKILDDEDNDIEIHIFSNKILFKFEQLLFQSRLLNGSYPNVSNLIPEKFNIEITTDLQNLYDALDRATLFSEKEKNVVYFETSDNEAVISSTSAELGKVEEKIEISKNKTENIKIAFNVRYMLEALRALQSKKVMVLLQNEVNPIIIKDPNNENLIELILPIKTY